MFAYINPRRRDLFASAFALQVAEIEAGKREFISHGNLDSIRTLIDVRDAMRAYWIACDKCKVGEAYNIGGSDTLTVGDFLIYLISQSTKKIETRLNKDLLRPVDVTKQVPDTRKFDTLTGWKNKYCLSDSINFLLEHYRKEVKCN
jgi:GDPmannose 4,6-dehydratase/GDP-4-dehydro-6-deoxy-D-mannose reductase